MYDSSKLRGRIVEKFGSQSAFAEAAHRSISFVSQYLNGKVYLDQRMIEEWAVLLDISNDEIPVYFFTKRVHDTEQIA